MIGYLFRDRDEYKKRAERVKVAIESYYNDVVERDDDENIEEVMLSAYDLAQYIRKHGTVSTWHQRQFAKHVHDAMVDAAEITVFEKTFAMAYEVQKLESVSRSIFEYLKDKRGIEPINVETKAIYTRTL
jgi:hypothetical protein